MTAEMKLTKVYDAIREVRAGKSPRAWTPAEARLFGHLPEVLDAVALRTEHELEAA